MIFVQKNVLRQKTFYSCRFCDESYLFKSFNLHIVYYLILGVLGFKFISLNILIC